MRRRRNNCSNGRFQQLKFRHIESCMVHIMRRSHHHRTKDPTVRTSIAKPRTRFEAFAPTLQPYTTSHQSSQSVSQLYTYVRPTILDSLPISSFARADRGCRATIDFYHPSTGVQLPPVIWKIAFGATFPFATKTVNVVNSGI